MDTSDANEQAVTVVLVIDDDRDGCELMADALRGAGYLVFTASNGQEGLDVLRVIRPAVIFLDVNMPIMDGPHFRQLQRQDASLIGIPTVVMTADANINPMLDMAIDQTIRKPVAVRELLSIVGRHAEPRH